MRRLVVLGGGTAGTMVVNMLRRKLDRSQWTITVVDRDDSHRYQPGYLFVPFGTYQAADVTRSRHSFIADGVELVLSEIEQIDPETSHVHLADGRQLGYD
jgi:sulfide:quinone oxidoreductase